MPRVPLLFDLTWLTPNSTTVTIDIYSTNFEHNIEIGVFANLGIMTEDNSETNPQQEATAQELHLKKISVSDMDNNCYLIHSENEGLLVDAADNALGLLKMADEAGVKITKVLTTHRHWDHVRALKDVLHNTGATHYAPYLDAPALPAHVDVELHQGDVIEFAGHEIPVMILRGHTPGGAAINVKIDGKNNLFVGDSLFPGGVGKTTSESDFERLFNDVKTYIFDVFSNDTIVWPGHGDNTTIGDERPHLEEWWERRY